MKIRPILFNTDIVRAILDGRKTVTRRRIKPEQLSGVGCKLCPNNMPGEFLRVRESMFKPFCDMPDNELIGAIYKPPCEPGDILYVREAFGEIKNADASHKKYVYKATDTYPFGVKGYIVKFHWHPAIHMPKEAARIWLKVTNVRAERLQDISGHEVLKEGINSHVHPEADYFNMNQREMFEKLWNSTIQKSDQDLYGWNANPWVWVIRFERCEKPEGWCV